MPMKFNFYGLHWETFFLLQFWHHPNYSGLSVETSHIHSHSWHHHFSGTSMPFCYPCLFKTQSSISCYVQLWLWVYLSLLLLPRYCSRYEASLYQWILSGGKQSSKMNQPDVGTVFPCVLQLPPLAEFAYNNAPSATTGISLFFANKGYHPNLIVYPEQDIASSHARDFIVDLDELQGILKEEITKAQRQYQPSTDSHWQQPLDFQVGQLVFVRSQYFQTTRPLKKLSEKYLRLYEIIAQPSLQSFILHFPNTIRAVYPMFHVSMIEPATFNTFQQHSKPLLVPVVIDREPE